MRDHLPPIAAGVLIAALPLLPGCVVAGVVSAMGQSAEYQKLIEVPAEYPGLEGRSVAVIVDADLSLRYEHPRLVDAVLSGVSARLHRDVPGAKVLSPLTVVAFQSGTPQWNALPYGEIARRLSVERLVHVEILEYRLNPPGNSWMWQGEAMAEVGIIEAEGFDPDTFIEVITATARYPLEDIGITRENASAAQIETGLMGSFVREIAWKFHFHVKPKYPKYYRGGPVQ
jgi:hypothetical protein